MMKNQKTKKILIASFFTIPLPLLFTLKVLFPELLIIIGPINLFILAHAPGIFAAHHLMKTKKDEVTEYSQYFTNPELTIKLMLGPFILSLLLVGLFSVLTK